MVLINAFVRRDFLKAGKDVVNVCYYCNSCKRWEKFHSLRNELKKKGFNSFNKNVPFWNVYKDRFLIEPLPLDFQM